MSTRGTLITEIEGDIGRSDLTSYITTQITRVIEKELQHKKFWFNTTVDFEFAMVSGTYKYTSTTTDTLNGSTITLADFWDIASVWLLKSGDYSELELCDIKTMISRYDGSESSGEPYDWAWDSETLWLYPKPNTTDNIKVTGHYNYPAPTSDGESSNVWMVHAYEYIKEKVKYNIYMNRINNPERRALAQAGVIEYRRTLNERTGRKTQKRPIEGSEMPC